jgi:hypothetical protein
MSFNATHNAFGGDRPSFGRGVAAGVGAAAAGALLWAVIGVLTGFQVGFVAVGVGYLVGAATARYGRTGATSTMAASAVIAFAGAVVGHLGSVYASAIHETGLGLTTVITTYGPVDVLTNTELTDGLTWGFFVLAAFTAARISIRAANHVPAPVGHAASYPPPLDPAITSEAGQYPPPAAPGFDQP